MNTLDAFMMGEANRGKEMMVFDWDKAARLIAQRKPRIAMAGLRGGWEFTGGVIYEDGVLVTKDYTFLVSTWAVPRSSKKPSMTATVTGGESARNRHGGKNS